MATPRTIKKYPNRRLYDTQLSRYITLADVRELVMQGSEFKVIDAASGEDLTRTILLQIIIDQESGGEPLFTAELLAKLIRFYGDSVQGLFARYLDQSLSLFIEQHTRWQRQLHDMLALPPVDAMAELTKRNFELWKDIQEQFLRAARPQPPDTTKPTTPKDA